MQFLIDSTLFTTLRCSCLQHPKLVIGKISCEQAIKQLSIIEGLMFTLNDRKKVADLKLETPDLYCSDFALYLFYIYEPSLYQIICRNLNPDRTNRNLIQALLFDETSAVSGLTSNYAKIDTNVKLNHKSIIDLYKAAQVTVNNFKISEEQSGK